MYSIPPNHMWPLASIALYFCCYKSFRLDITEILDFPGWTEKRTGDITKDPPFFQPSLWALIVYPAMGDSTRTIAGQHPAGNHMMDLDDGMGHHTLG